MINFKDDERLGVSDGIVGLMVAHDGPTGIHLNAVGDLSCRLAMAMGLSEGTVKNVFLAGRLHDAGKLFISPDVLNKPAMLDDDEWRKMKRHADMGAKVVEKFPMLAPLRHFIQHHHERIDGTGYPMKLIGSEIPFESRLIAVTDAFHAMTVPRPYLTIRDIDDALNELGRCAGTQFDDEIVDAFDVMIRKTTTIRSHHVSVTERAS